MAAAPPRDFVFTKLIHGARWLWDRVIWRYKYLLLSLIAAAALLGSTWSWISPFFNRKVVIYTAGVTGGSTRYGEQIAKDFKPPDSPWFIHYEFEVRRTEGLKENRENISRAKPGELVIAFDQDGFDPPNEVRTLLPLSDLYLHLVAHRGDLDAINGVAQGPGSVAGGVIARDSAPRPLTFERLMAHHKTQKQKAQPPGARTAIVGYFGPRGSGTRQIAEVVLRYYKLNPRDLDVGDHLDFPAAYGMLARREIDFLFDASDLGSRYIADMAATGQYTLVGLDNADGMATTGKNSLRAQTIKKGSYTIDEGFCPADLQTVSTRRLITCPTSMSKSDAFYLTSGIREALRQVIPSVAWEKEELKAPAPGLILPLHPGAEDYRANRVPWWWRWLLDNWWFSLVGAFSFFVWLLQRQDTNRPPVLILSRSEITVPKNTLVGPLQFGIGDAETDADRLKVEWETDRPEMFPNKDGVLTHSGKDCSIRLQPAKDAIGTARVTIKVTDTDGAVTTTMFTVHVVEAVAPAAPVISPPPAPAEPQKRSVELLEKLFDDIVALEQDRQDLSADAPPSKRRALGNRVDQLKSRIRNLRVVLGPDFAAELDDATAKIRDIETQLRPPTPTAPGQTTATAPSP